MAEKKKIILEFDAETGKVTQQLDQVKTSVKETKTEVDNVGGAFNNLDGVTGGFASKAKGAFKAGVQGAKSMIVSMKTLRGAVISTGIGAIVVAVVAMIQAVSRLQVVQDKYKSATAGLSAIFDVLMDSVAYLGEHLIKLFENPQQSLKDFGELIKQNIMNRLEGMLDLIPKLGESVALLFKGEFSEAGKVATDALGMAFGGVENLSEGLEQGAEALKEYADKLLQAGIQATRLAMLEQQLEDVQISQIESQAKRNKQIAEARLITNDETKSYEERLDALKEALELEQQSLAEKLANAKTEASIIKQKNAISESSRDDRRAEAEANAKVYEVERESIEKQKALADELKGLNDRFIASEKAKTDALNAYKEAQISAVDEIAKVVFDAGATAIEREIMANEEKYNTLLSQADQYGIDRAELEEARQIELDAILAKHDEIRSKAKEDGDKKIREDEIKLKDSRVAIAGEAVGAIMGLTEAFAKDGEEGAKRQFKVAKALGIAEAIVNTSRAIMAQLSNPDPTAVITGRNFVQAGIAGALGVAQVAKIARSQFGGSGGGDTPSISGGGGGAPSAPQQTAPQIDFGFLQQGANQPAIQAYVLAQNVSNSTQANQLIKDQSAL